MPQKFENPPPNWNAIEEECQNFPLTCPWTIICKNGTLEFIITSLEWTFNYDFWIRVTAHLEGNPNNLQQVNIDKHHFLPEYLSEALYDYVKYSETHLNSHQFPIFGELFDFLF